MTDANLTRLIVDELRKVAPETDPTRLAPHQPIREALEIDSFDFLNVLIGLSRATGVEVPEADYGRLTTMEAMLRYFRERHRADARK
jgi:acyl carrier protein